MLRPNVLALALMVLGLALSGPAARAADPTLSASLAAPEIATPDKAACSPSSTALCLNGSRFRLTARWRTPNGATGDGHPVALTGDTGYFWFFGSSNAEFVVKVINGCSVSNRYWVFAGGLTNVQVDLTVEDTATGTSKTYHNPQNTAFRPIQDTNAFAGCRGRLADRAVPVPSAEKAESLIVQHGRFRVSASWRTPDGRRGAGQAVPLTDETGYFWFFDPSNVEMILKVLDGCAGSGRFWVFAGGLTNVEVTIRVEDTATGVVKSYTNPLNTPFAPIQDTGAFVCSADGLPPDPGVGGLTTLAGVDTDRDGIRDDLQRYIVQTYGSSAVSVSALKQAVKTVQSAVLDAASASPSIDHANQMLRDLECLSAVRPADGAKVHKGLVARALNTEARGLAFLRYSDQLGGQAFPLQQPDDWRTSCGFPVNATADGVPLPPPPADKAACTTGGEATVFFVNGVLTDYEDAVASGSFLEVVARQSLPAADIAKMRFLLAYNPTYSVIDFWEVVKQRLENDFSRFYRYLSRLEPMPDFMQELYKFRAAAIDFEALFTSPTTQNHLRLYRNELLEGKKVILVAHSQGNLFANREYMSLSAEERRSVGIVSVANPDSRVADGRPYTTLTRDLVIRATPGALGPTTDNGIFFDLNDPLGHGFTESYLAAGNPSRSRILGHLKDAFDTVPRPTAEATEGVITVTLSWGAQPDVDLHVFEPNGTHVYYSHQQGVSGFLDVDDVTSFGPEHFYVSCSTLETGTYRVGVNYYSGSAPEVANVQIQAGLLIRNFSIPLAQSFGSAGNGSPIPVANIVVTGNARDGYEFQVQ
jgi:hypothetical protein